MPIVNGKVWSVLIALSLGLGLIGCSSAAPPEEAAPEVEFSAPDQTPAAQPELQTELIEPVSPLAPVSPVAEPTMSPGSRGLEALPEGSQALVEAVMADLAQQRSLPADEISVVSVEPQQWSDASLGCPQEGFMYAQVVTPGYLIILEAGGQQYAYHTDRAGNFVLCEN